MGEFIQETEASLGQEEYGIVVYGWVFPLLLNLPSNAPGRYPAARFISSSPRGGIARRAIPGPVMGLQLLLNRVRLFAIPWTVARQASLSFTVSR